LIDFKNIIKIWLLTIFVGGQILFCPNIAVATTIELSATFTGGDNDAQIRGDILIRGWNVDSSRRCLLLRYNNPKYGWDHGEQRRIDKLSGGSSRTRYLGGHTEISTLDKTGIKYRDDLHHIIEVKNKGAVHLGFWSSVPKPSSQTDKDWFLDGFYPQPLTKCPPKDELLYLPIPETADISAKILHHSDYIAASQNSIKSKLGFETNISGRALAFAFSKSYKKHRFVHGATEINMYYHNDSILNLQSTLSHSLAIIEPWAGEFPYKSLTFVETTDLTRLNLPGIISFSTPRQTVFSKAQSAKNGFINWSHWVATKLLAGQWYGASIGASLYIDRWLIEGNRDFLTLEALSSKRKIYNLFKNPRILSMTYLQMQEYSAASMRQRNPFTALTNSKWETLIPANQQNPLLSIKQMFAMRQLKHSFAEKNFQKRFRLTSMKYLGDSLSPREFIEELASKPNSSSQIRSQIGQWWTRSGWPDYSLQSINSTKRKQGDWLSSVRISQLGSIDSPPLVMIESENSARYFVRAKKGKSSKTWQADLVTKTKAKTVIIDPNHESYDANRFNNSNSMPDIKFFPGSATSIIDNGYTIFWMPYPQRRPGEPWAIVLHGALFKFINSGVFFSFEYAPDGQKTRSFLRYRYQIPDFGIHGDFKFEQNFDGDRVTESTLVRTPLFRGNPRISLNAGLRRKERMGVMNSDHLTTVIGLGAKPEGYTGACGYKTSGEYERAPEKFAHDFSYERKKYYGSIGCGKRGFSLGIRLFAGQLDKEGLPPEAAFFKPTASTEAGLLITQSNQIWPEKIKTIGSNLLFPLHIPLPNDTLILSNRLRGTAFYQFGKSKGPENEYRAAGIGLKLPFGGDLTGTGTLSFTTLSAYIVLYSRVNENISERPSAYFTMSGDL
jgi:hypothetical protein